MRFSRHLISLAVLASFPSRGSQAFSFEEPVVVRAMPENEIPPAICVRVDICLLFVKEGG